MPSTDAWQQILIPILKMRKEAGLVNLFPQYITGEVSATNLVHVKKTPEGVRRLETQSVNSWRGRVDRETRIVP